MVRVEGRAKWIGASKFEQIMKEACECREVPVEWEQQACRMKKAADDGRVIVGDDRDAGKAWMVSEVQMFINMIQGLLEDRATWLHRPDVTPDEVTS